MVWFPVCWLFDAALTGLAVEVLVLVAHPAYSAIIAVEIRLGLCILIKFLEDIAHLAEIVTEFNSTLLARFGWLCKIFRNYWLTFWVWPQLAQRTSGTLYLSN